MLHIKKGSSKWKYSLHATLQDLPSLENHLTEVERLIEQMERELEEYLNE